MGINEIMQIGNRIKGLRKAKGITQKEMARRLSLPASTYSNYENNFREPNKDILKKIAVELGITTPELIYLTYRTPEDKLKATEFVKSSQDHWIHDEDDLEVFNAAAKLSGYYNTLNYDQVIDLQKLIYTWLTLHSSEN